MAGRVQYLLGEWRSPVARLLWEQDVAGSNPVSPTNFYSIIYFKHLLDLPRRIWGTIQGHLGGNTLKHTALHCFGSGIALERPIRSQSDSLDREADERRLSVLSRYSPRSAIGQFTKVRLNPDLLVFCATASCARSPTPASSLQAPFDVTMADAKAVCDNKGVLQA